MDIPLPQDGRERVIVRVLVFLEDADAAEELVGRCELSDLIVVLTGLIGSLA